MNKFLVEKLNIDSNKPYIIGETAYNHEGDIVYLKQMITEIAELKLNAVKFHLLLKLESYMQKKHSLLTVLKQWVFSEVQWREIFAFSESKKLDVVALCDDVESMEFINKEFPDLFAIELHASCLNDLFLLKEAAKFKGLIVVGVGGSTLDEIEYAVRYLTAYTNKILLMYGFQSYPTDYKDINLNKMLKLCELYNLPVGYADHMGFDDNNNEQVSAMGAFMGVNVLEKHYTCDFGKKRIDYHSAVGKKQMRKIKKLMELGLTVRGSGNIEMSEPELKYGNTGPMKKAIVAKRDLKAGTKLTEQDLWFKRTEEETPVKQYQFKQFLGLELVNDVGEDEIIDFSKVEYKFQKLDQKSFTNT
jgi:N,N'-diacetyllegionaminate synthase